MVNLYELNDNERKIATDVVGLAMSKYGLNLSETDIDISMVDSKVIRELNRETRNIDLATDILTFPNIDMVLPYDKNNYNNDINPETGNVILGEIIIARDVMTGNAEEYGHSVTREFAYLVTHGMMHLMGYDHINDADKQIMRIKEDEILNELGYTRDL